MLHPLHKLKYFEAQGWEDEWIDSAKEVVRHEFEEYYSEMRDATGTNNNGAQDRHVKKVSCSLFSYYFN